MHSHLLLAFLSTVEVRLSVTSCRPCEYTKGFYVMLVGVWAVKALVGLPLDFSLQAPLAF